MLCQVCQNTGRHEGQPHLKRPKINLFLTLIICFALTLLYIRSAPFTDYDGMKFTTRSPLRALAAAASLMIHHPTLLRGCE